MAWNYEPLLNSEARLCFELWLFCAVLNSLVQCFVSFLRSFRQVGHASALTLRFGLLVLSRVFDSVVNSVYSSYSGCLCIGVDF